VNQKPHEPKAAVRTAREQAVGLACGQRERSDYPCGRRRVSGGERRETGDGLMQDVVALAEREAHEGARRVLVVAEHGHRHADHPAQRRHPPAEVDGVAAPRGAASAITKYVPPAGPPAARPRKPVTQQVALALQ
jgi:hypothetical protein